MNQPSRAADELNDQKGELAKLPEALIARFAEMAMMLPETESDGGASIIEAILGTVNVGDLDKPWDAKDPEALCNEWLIVTDASRSMSDYADGLGVFLVVKAVQDDTGEEITFTTGSMAVVAQIVRAYAGDMFPLKCKMVMSDKPTKGGYRPMHLVIHEKQPGK